MSHMRGTKGGTIREVDPRPLGADAQANLDRLAAMGVQIGPDGVGSEIPFQGDSPSQGDEGLESQPITPSLQDVFAHEDVLEEAETGELPDRESADTQSSQPTHGPGGQTEEGLAKREADARKAQSEMSKMRLALDKEFADIRATQAKITEEIQKLTVLRTTVGEIPSELSPADAEVVSAYRAAEPEMAAVLDATVAPLYRMISGIKSAVDGLMANFGKHVEEESGEKVLGAVFSKVPEARVRAITESQEFFDWLSAIPSVATRKLYSDIVNNTTKYAADDALDVLSRFEKDTGIKVFDNQKPPVLPTKLNVVEVDRAPRLRTGAALPPAPPPVRPASEDTPLSTDELANFSATIRSASPEDAAILNKRLSRTNLNIDGTLPTGTFR